MEIERLNRNKIKALCDYLLGYWQKEVVRDHSMLEPYFKDKYDVDFDDLNIYITHDFSIHGFNYNKSALIELNNMLDYDLLDRDQFELRKLFIELMELIMTAIFSEVNKKIPLKIKQLYEMI